MPARRPPGPSASATAADSGAYAAFAGDLHGIQEEALRRALEELPDQERNVVQLRYGVDGSDGPVGIREASRRLGITQPETRKLEERALERLAGIREIEALREAA